ncbi:MAG: outer membrane protein assembly factor BamA [Alphaproteobacteria bacterium]|nr:outer membrane protein assembly factor BamA [Alphaproteobacteria bacterium]MBQ3117763.1 outer membrane protein assembly factor BamA [Alphaproteobacteria bacterium]MBR3914038.1 outer membrane protein assembly factor BamA [Alphaproteobacteria bacterium]
MKKIIGLLLMSSALATQASAEVLRSVSVNGTQRFENATILNELNFRSGQNITAADLDSATKKLFATGLYSDVSVKMKNGVMLVDVVENPTVYDVYFEGNDRLDDDVLKTEVELKPRSVYTQRKAQADADRLLDVYKRNGRFGATVTPKIIKKEQNRVDVIFEIDEGDKTYIEKINFIGNHEYSADDLKDVMITKENAWYRFFTSTDTYDPDRLNYDQEMLRRFYLKHGYVDFEVKNAVAELLPDKSGFVLTIEVDEGKRYKFAQPEIRVSLPEYQGRNKKDLTRFLEFKKDERFNSELIDTTIENLTDEFANAGYAFVEVIPDFYKDEKNQTVRVVFRVQEGEKVFVNKINIHGNSRTKDKVIRREFRIKEGDAFNAAKLRRSKQKVEDLDYFDKVDFKTVPVYGDRSKTNVDVNVSEKSTGAFNIGIGWSSYDGLLFETGIIERNILGTGNIVNLNAMLSQRETQYTAGFTNPYFMDKPLLAGIEIFKTTRDNGDYSSYSYDTIGTSARLGWDYTDRLHQTVRYTLRQDDVTDIDDDASTYIKEQKGKTTVSMIGQVLSYDRRDSRINPTEGYYLSLGTDIAGLGGDTKFFRVNVTGIQYFPVTDDVVWSIRGDGGHIWGLGGEDVRINNRYFLGDASLRGFEYGGVGARDKYTDDSLGGNWYVSASTEVVFPLGLPKELGIKGKVFSDAGYIGKPDGFDAEMMDYKNSLRASVGTGILWQSPMGMINLDFAAPVLKETGDKTQVFRLNFGKGF